MSVEELSEIVKQENNFINQINLNKWKRKLY